MVLEPVGKSELDLVVDGTHVDHFEVTEDGTIQVDTSATVEQNSVLQGMLSGNTSGSHDPFWGKSGQKTIFDFPQEVEVTFDWYHRVTEFEDDDYSTPNYTNGLYVRLVCDGNVIAETEDTAIGWDEQQVRQSGRVTAKGSSAHVEWETGDNDGGPAVVYDIDWEIAGGVESEVNVGVNSTNLQT